MPFADCDGYGHKVVNQTGELVLYPPITITKPIIGPVGPVDPETAGGGSRLWAVALLRPSEPRDGRAARLPTHPRPRGGAGTRSTSPRASGLYFVRYNSRGASVIKIEYPPSRNDP